MDIYLLWLVNDDIEPMLVGIADTMEQAKKMRAKVMEEMEDVFNCDIQTWKRNTVIIDDVDYTFD